MRFFTKNKKDSETERGYRRVIKGLDEDIANAENEQEKTDLLLLKQKVIEDGKKRGFLLDAK